MENELKLRKLIRESLKSLLDGPAVIQENMDRYNQENLTDDNGRVLMIDEPTDPSKEAEVPPAKD